MDKNQMKQTKFDSMVTNPTMQLVKAVIPYIDNSLGRYIGMLIKFQELQNAAKINNNISIAVMNADKHRGMDSMLEDIMDFLDDDTRETFENLKGMMEMMESMKDMNMDEDMMNAFMGSAFSGTNNSPFSSNDESSFDKTENSTNVSNTTNEKSVFTQNGEPYFNSDEEPLESQNIEPSYDINNDVNSSQIDYKKGLENHE